ncbi:MAG: transporter [Chromatiales bacterium]|nr:transporter [Chromatiales bacterium]
MPGQLIFAGAAAALFALVALGVPEVHGQELEPRAYSNTPTGLNFLLAGYGYTEGNLSFDPSVPIEGADLRTNSAVVAWARSLGVRGRSAKVDIVAPYTWLSGTALVEGQPRRREVAGFGDPRFRYSVNLYGAPALSLQEFSSYRQDVIVGASLQVSVPVGQYDDSKLVNIGTNRWAFKPELGISKSWGAWTVDVAAAAALYTDNTDFLGGSTLSQDPLYSVQGHIVYGFRSGIWLALDGTYYWGGQTSVDDVKADTLKRNTRLGLTVALPVDLRNSVKLFAGTGVSSRTGDEYDGLGVVWQYRFGRGFPR